MIIYCIAKNDVEPFYGHGYSNYWKIPRNIYYEGKAPGEVYTMAKREDDEYVYVYPNHMYPGYLPPTKKNMSHDLRGDIYIPYRQVSPWNQPSVAPIRNTGLRL